MKAWGNAPGTGPSARVRALKVLHEIVSRFHDQNCALSGLESEVTAVLPFLGRFPRLSHDAPLGLSICHLASAISHSPVFPLCLRDEPSPVFSVSSVPLW